MKATAHFLKRMMNRAISKEEIDFALQFGEEIYAYHSFYLFISKKVLKKYPVKPARQDKLNGLTIVMDPKSFEMITCFRNPDFKRKIRYKH